MTDALVMSKPQYMAGEHFYLSTGCLHGQHEHCRSSRNIDGDPKEPGTCKWCPAKCICPCHYPPREPIVCGDD